MIILNSSPKRSVRALVVVCSVLFLHACATTPPAVDSPSLEPDTPRTDGFARGETEDQKVAQLWSSAEKARQSGQDAVALNLLYEALDISPQNPLLWSRAAELQLDALEAALAESYATKSNAFASADDRTLLYRNWLIIEQARQIRGDLLGVRSAHRKVQEYQYR